MKRLAFSGSGAKERYEIIYDGITGTTRGFEAPGETRVIGKVLDKLESIGKTGEREDGRKSFILNGYGAGIVDLEEAEFQLAIQCLNAVRWTVQGARKATDAVEWFLKAEEPPVQETHDATK